MFDYNDPKLNKLYTDSPFSSIYNDKLKNINKLAKYHYLNTGDLLLNEDDSNLYVDLINKSIDYTKKLYEMENNEKLYLDTYRMEDYIYYENWFNNYYNYLLKKKKLNETEKIILSLQQENLDNIIINPKVLSYNNYENSVKTFIFTHRKTGKKLVFKRIRSINFDEIDQLNNIEMKNIREVFINMFFNNKKLPFNIPKCYGYIPCFYIDFDNVDIECGSENDIFIITEYIDNTVTLYDYLKNDFNVYDLTNIILNVIEILKILNDKYGFIHGDLHLGNILLNKETLELSLIDFDRSCININNRRHNFITNMYFGNTNVSPNYVSSSSFYDIYPFLNDLFHLFNYFYTNVKINNSMENKCMLNYILKIAQYYNSENTDKNYNIMYYSSDIFYIHLPEFYNFIDDIKPIGGLIEHIKKLNKI